MATILFVQMYPYEARYGGDPEYIMKLSTYLKNQGHKVHFVVSDMTRGRSAPWYISPYPIDSFASFRVRRAVRFGRLVVSMDPGMVLKALRSIAARIGVRARPKVEVREGDGVSSSERSWVAAAALRLDTQIVVLCYGAVELAGRLAAAGRYVVALPSVVPGRRLVLDGSSAGDAATANAIPVAFVAALAEADLIAVTVEDDARALRDKLPRKDVIIAKLGYVFRPNEGTGTQSVLFVGNDTAANIESIRWFLDDIWPSVLDQVPGAQLRIVGHVGRSLKPMQRSRVELVGAVRDLPSEYAHAQVVVAPMTQGTASMKTKVVEAISFGCPIVTTSIGVDPADPNQFDEAGFVANAAEIFADCVSKLLLSPEIRAAKARGAFAVHSRFFSPAASYADLESRIAVFLAGTSLRA